MKKIFWFYRAFNLQSRKAHFFLTLAIFFSLSVLPAKAARVPIVAVIDSGVDKTHTVFDGRLVGGYDFTEETNPYLDNVGHGTAMASIIAADGSVPGRCLNCRIMSLKVTNSMEVPLGRMAQAINYAVTQGVNLIYIGAGSYSGSEALRLAVERAAEYGIPIVAPSGTQGLPHPLYPAAYESVISVVGMTLTGQTISKSNFGGRDAVFSPGDRILAAKSGGGFHWVSGSSPAAAWRSGEMAQRISTSREHASIQNTNTEKIVLASPQKPSKEIARLQYSETDDHDLIVDAPWRTIRSYLPVLFFTPEFHENSPRIKSFELSNYEPTSEKTELIFKNDVAGFDDKRNCQSTSGLLPIKIIDPEGSVRNPARKEEKIDDFWHYIARVPKGCIGLSGNRGKKGEHFLLAVIKWKKKRKVIGDWKNHTYTRVLRVIIDDVNGVFPQFHRSDRHYDIHVHTIAEQTNWGVLNNDSSRKSFGGPLAMLVESAYALGMVNIQLKDGNWLDYKDRIATTDHNVFFSKPPFDSGAEPGYGPTGIGKTNGDIEEFNWYRKHFGDLGGEELTVAGAGLNNDLLQLQILMHQRFPRLTTIECDNFPAGGQRCTGYTLEEFLDFARENFKGDSESWAKLLKKIKANFDPHSPPVFVPRYLYMGGHFLSYGAPHMEGPWHGGDFDASSYLPTDIAKDGVRSSLDLPTILKTMSSTNGFGYAAHPYDDPIGWSKGNFDRVIGFAPYNISGKGSIILQKGGTDFVFKGSQVWNGKKDKVSRSKKLKIGVVEKLSPFSLHSSGDELWELQILMSQRFPHLDSIECDNFPAGGSRCTEYTLEEFLDFAKENFKGDEYSMRVVLDMVENKFDGRNSPIFVTDQVFVDNPNWDNSLTSNFEKYLQQVKQGLVYRFQEKPNHRFIRKVFISAGTDAHGDFNYGVSSESTAIAEVNDYLRSIFGWERRIAKVSNNAFGRVRTYTLTSEKLLEDGGFQSPLITMAPGEDNENRAVFSTPSHIPSPEDDPDVENPYEGPYLGSAQDLEAAVNAYREGNTVLTDGPIGKFSLDANCRFNSALSLLLWHDADCRWENHDGGIGGRGNFDGGRTALVGNESPEIYINTIWKGRNHHVSSTIRQAEEMRFKLHQVMSSGNVQIIQAPAAGPPGKFQTTALAGFKDFRGHNSSPSALVMSGEMGNTKTLAKFITNPIWTVPVKISIEHPERCSAKIPAGRLKVMVDFGISMNTKLSARCSGDNCRAGEQSTYTGAKIFVKPLDSNGKSIGSGILLTSQQSWNSVPVEEFKQIADARYSASNAEEIFCANGESWDWDANSHQKKQGYRSYAVILTDLKDMHGNPLNAVAKTFVTKKSFVFVPPNLPGNGGVKVTPKESKKCHTIDHRYPKGHPKYETWDCPSEERSPSNPDVKVRRRPRSPN